MEAALHSPGQMRLANMRKTMQKNDVGFGLSASIYTKGIGNMLSFINEIDAGEEERHDYSYIRKKRDMAIRCKNRKGRT
jgi:hypothetical protein